MESLAVFNSSLPLCSPSDNQFLPKHPQPCPTMSLPDLRPAMPKLEVRCAVQAQSAEPKPKPKPKEAKFCGGRFEESVTDAIERFTESNSIHQGLSEIDRRIESGEFEWRTDREDVHMNIEAALTDLIGESAKKLHTARSRNDQVLTDFRLWCRDAIDAIGPKIKHL